MRRRARARRAGRARRHGPGERGARRPHPDRRAHHRRRRPLPVARRRRRHGHHRLRLRRPRARRRAGPLRRRHPARGQAAHQRRGAAAAGRPRDRGGLHRRRAAARLHRAGRERPRAQPPGAAARPVLPGQRVEAHADARSCPPSRRCARPSPPRSPSPTGSGAAIPFAVLAVGLAVLVAIVDSGAARAAAHQPGAQRRRSPWPGSRCSPAWRGGRSRRSPPTCASAVPGRHSDAGAALDDARIAVLQARSNESLVLVARNSGGGSSDDAFSAQHRTTSVNDFGLLGRRRARRSGARRPGGRPARCRHGLERRPPRRPQARRRRPVPAGRRFGRRPRAGLAPGRVRRARRGVGRARSARSGRRSPSTSGRRRGR